MVNRLAIIASAMLAYGATVQPVVHKQPVVPAYVMPLPPVEWPGLKPKRLPPQVVPGYDRGKKWQCVGECLWI